MLWQPVLFVKEYVMLLDFQHDFVTYAILKMISKEVT